MNLIELKCKNCNAALEIKKDTNIIICTYCGTKYILMNDVKKLIQAPKEETVEQLSV